MARSALGLEFDRDAPLIARGTLWRIDGPHLYLAIAIHPSPRTGWRSDHRRARHRIAD
jgi:hypothetical protein